VVRAVLLVVGVVHVLAAIAWLVVLVARDGTGPRSLVRAAAARVREPRRWTPRLAVLVGGSGLALLVVELTEGAAGGPFSRGVVAAPSSLWLGLVAGKLVALVVATLAGAVDGMGLDAHDPPPRWVPPASVGTSAVVVGMVLGLVADVVGVDG
jgi:hypothetical protein